MSKDAEKDFKKYVFAGVKFEFEADDDDNGEDNGEDYGEEEYYEEEDEDYRRNLKVQQLNDKYKYKKTGQKVAQRDEKRRLESYITEDEYYYWVEDEYGYYYWDTYEDQYLVSYDYDTYDKY